MKTPDPITKDTLLGEIKATRGLGTRARAALKSLGCERVSDLGKLTQKKVVSLENTGLHAWKALEQYRSDVADMITSNGSHKTPTAKKPLVKGDPKADFAEVYAEGHKAGMICFEEMIHEHAEGEEDEVGIISIDPFSIACVEQGRNTHPIVHYVIAGQQFSIKANHRIEVLLNWIAVARKKATALKRGE